MTKANLPKIALFYVQFVFQFPEPNLWRNQKFQHKILLVFKHARVGAKKKSFLRKKKARSSDLNKFATLPVMLTDERNDMKF